MLNNDIGYHEDPRNGNGIIRARTTKQIQEWGTYEAIVDGKKVFIRPGSKKPKGWQITFRGRKPGSFIDSLHKGIGYLLVSRDGVLLIPLYRREGNFEL